MRIKHLYGRLAMRVVDLRAWLALDPKWYQEYKRQTRNNKDEQP